MSKYFELFTEIIGWLRIFASPFLVSVIVAAIIYFSNQTWLNLIIALLICLIVFVGGIILATRKFKSEKGTIEFLSRTMATPELEHHEEKEILK